MKTIPLNYHKAALSSANLTRLKLALGRTLRTIQVNDARLAPMQGEAFVAFKGRRSYLESEIGVQIEHFDEMQTLLDNFRKDMSGYIAAASYESDIRVNAGFIGAFTRIIANQVEEAFAPVPITEATEMYQIWNSGSDWDGDGVSEGYWELDHERINKEMYNGDKIAEIQGRLTSVKEECAVFAAQMQTIYDENVKPFAEADERYSCSYTWVYGSGVPMEEYEKGFGIIYGKLWTLDDKGLPVPDWAYLRECMNTDPSKLSPALLDAIALLYEQLIVNLSSGDDAEAYLTKFLQCSYIDFRDIEGNPLDNGIIPYGTNIRSELSPVFIAMAERYRERTMPWLQEQAAESLKEIGAARQLYDAASDRARNAAAWSNASFKAKQFGVQLLTNVVRYCGEGYGWSSESASGDGYAPRGSYEHLTGTMVDIGLEKIDGKAFDYKLSVWQGDGLFQRRNMEIEMYEFRVPDGIAGRISNSNTGELLSIMPNADAEAGKSIGMTIGTSFISTVGGFVVAGVEIGHEWDTNRAAEIETRNRVEAVKLGNLYNAAGVYGAISIVDGAMGQPDFLIYDKDRIQQHMEYFQQSDDAWKNDEGVNLSAEDATDKLERTIQFDFRDTLSGDDIDALIYYNEDKGWDH